MKQRDVFFLTGIALALAACVSFSADTSPNKPVYTGDGGKGKGIAVLTPVPQGLTGQDAETLPLIAQSVLVGNFSKYSAISVLDRVSLEKTLQETESGIYADEDVYGRLGEIPNVDYALGGSLVKTGRGYSLSVTVTDTRSMQTAASYNTPCSAGELENYTAVNRTTLEILTQMGVHLTDTAKRELSGASSSETVKAQTALAQGITAQRNGDEFGAMLRYFDARTFDAGLGSEAVSRIGAANAAAVSTGSGSGLRDRVAGDIRQQQAAVRNEAERKKKLEEVLKKASVFYQEHQPVSIDAEANFVIGNTDYKRETVEMTVGMRLNPLTEEFSVINQLASQAAGIGYPNWPFRYKLNPVTYLAFLFPPMGVSLVAGAFGVNNDSFSSGIWTISFNSDNGPIDLVSKLPQRMSVEADIVNDNGKTLKRIKFPLEYNPAEFIRGMGWMVAAGKEVKASTAEASVNKTFTVKVDDLTDHMTIRIVSVNGKNINSVLKNGYVRIKEPAKRLSVKMVATKEINQMSEAEIWAFIREYQGEKR
jgi:hypothetical protein